MEENGLQEQNCGVTKGIIGAIIGDIVGSRFEWDNYRATDFEFAHEECFFTDDSVMTIAVAEWLMAKDMKYIILRSQLWSLKNHMILFINTPSSNFYFRVTYTLECKTNLLF